METSKFEHESFVRVKVDPTSVKVPLEMLPSTDLKNIRLLKKKREEKEKRGKKRERKAKRERKRERERREKREERREKREIKRTLRML